MVTAYLWWEVMTQMRDHNLGFNFISMLNLQHRLNSILDTKTFCEILVSKILWRPKSSGAWEKRQNFKSHFNDLSLNLILQGIHLSPLALPSGCLCPDPLLLYSHSSFLPILGLIWCLFVSAALGKNLAFYHQYQPFTAWLGTEVTKHILYNSSQL